MKARFIGEDGSMGFEYGRVYEIRTWVDKSFFSSNAFLWIKDVNSNLKCPYSNMEALLENWEIGPSNACKRKAMGDIKIKYFSEDYPRLEKICQGDWIDLRIDNLVKHEYSGKHPFLNWKEGDGTVYIDEITYERGDILKFGLGVAMELPKGCEAIVVPRSSTFKNWGLIQTNSPGVIDNSYCGDGDQWMVEFIAMRDGSINRFDRVCQFRIQENQPDIEFEEVDHLGNESRGGYGSTGKQ